MSRDISITETEGLKMLRRDIKRSRLKYSRGVRGIRVSRGTNGTKIRIIPGRASATAAPSSGPWSITISGATATVGAGYIKFRGTYYQASQTAVAVNGGSLANPDYIVAKFVLASATLSIEANSLSTVPSDTSDILYFVLHEVYRNGASALHKLQRMNSDIIMESTLT